MHNVQVILGEITADFSSKKHGDQSSTQWYIQSAITKKTELYIQQNILQKWRRHSNKQM